MTYEKESISNRGLRGLLLNFRLLFGLHSRIPANEDSNSMLIVLVASCSGSAQGRVIEMNEFIVAGFLRETPISLKMRDANWLRLC